MDERQRFIDTRLRTGLSLAALCRRFGVSRKTGYKWLRRFEADGLPGLADRSSRPHGCAHATPRELEAAIVGLRRRHPFYSAKKIRWYLERRHSNWALPSKSTFHNILRRHGLIPRRRRSPRRWHPGRPRTVATAPNHLWPRTSKASSAWGPDPTAIR